MTGTVQHPQRSEPTAKVFQRKWATFRRDPLNSSREKLQRLIRVRTKPLVESLRRFLQQRAKRQLHSRHYTHLFATRPAHALAPDYADLWFLYRTVKARKPRCVLEFGSGCSTIILAQAVLENAQESDICGHVYSVDADPYWAAVAQETIPEHLRSVCDIFYSPLREVEHQGTPAFQHATIPDVTPDFLYIDGPALTHDRRVTVDVLDLQQHLPKGCFIVIDGRWQTAMFLKRHIKRRQASVYRWPFRNHTIQLLS